MTKYTVFAGSKSGSCDMGWVSNDWRECSSLDELIRQVVVGEPTAWAPVCLPVFGRPEAEKVFAESIAAGRLIEKVGDRYIARGVSEEEKAASEEMTFEELMLDLLSSAYGAIERIRPALTWNQPAKTDRFHGFVTVSGSISQPTPASKFTSPDLKETSHQVSPGFGSAYIGKA